MAHVDTCWSNLVSHHCRYSSWLAMFQNCKFQLGALWKTSGKSSWQHELSRQCHLVYLVRLGTSTGASLECFLPCHYDYRASLCSPTTQNGRHFPSTFWESHRQRLLIKYILTEMSKNYEKI